MQTGPYDADEAVGQPGVGDRWRRAFGTDASTPSLWRGLGLGLLATAAGLGVAELVVGLVEGSSSPVVPVGQEFIDYTPAWLKNWAIEQFGTNDKAVLVAGALIVILILGGIIGVLAVRGAKGMAYGLTVAVGIIGGWAVVIRPEPTLAKLLPTLVGTGVSLGVLWWLAPRKGPPDEAGRPTMIGPDRRQFLQGAVGIGSIAAITGGIGWTIRRRFEIDKERSELVLPVVAPDQAAPAAAGEFSLGVDGIESFVVPNDRFYRIDTALVVPQVAVDSWKLKHRRARRQPDGVDVPGPARPPADRATDHTVVRVESGRRRPRRQRAVAGRPARRHPRRGRAPGGRRTGGVTIDRRLDLWLADRGDHGRPRRHARDRDER